MSDTISALSSATVYSPVKQVSRIAQSESKQPQVQEDVKSAGSTTNNFSPDPTKILDILV